MKHLPNSTTALTEKLLIPVLALFYTPDSLYPQEMLSSTPSCATLAEPGRILGKEQQLQRQRLHFR